MTLNVTKKILNILLCSIIIFSILLAIFLYFGVHLKITESGFLYIILFLTLIFFDLFFYILPITIVSFFVWLYFLLYKVYKKSFNVYWNKTKYMFFILVISIILGIISCITTDATGAFLNIYGYNPY